MRWDNRRLDDRIRAEARSRQIDMSKYITMQEAMRIMGWTHEGVRGRADWLESVTLCGRMFVKRDRTEWLRKFRDGTLPSNDLMGESLAPFDVAARRAEIQREKDDKEEERRRQEEAERSEGFHVDAYGEVWWDYDNNDTWVTVRQAALNLGIAPQNVNNLADRGVIRRRFAHKRTYQPIDIANCKMQIAKCKLNGGPSMKGYLAMFSLREIEEYMVRRDNRGRRRAVSFNDPDRPFTPVRTHPMESSEHENCILPLRKVAEILGVGRKRVSELVSRGKLKAYSEMPGRQGVRAWFSQAEVLKYAKSPDRVRRRGYYDEYRKRKGAGTWAKRDREPYEAKFGEPAVYNLNRNIKKDYGEYYTVRQAAEILGCSTTTLKLKLKRGILKGSRAAPTNDPNAKWNDRRWWFVKKEDLDAYKGSRDYRKGHKAYVKRRHFEMFGEEIDDRSGAPTNEVPKWVKDAERGPVTPGEDRYIPHDPRNVVFLRSEQQRWRDEAYAYLEELKGWDDPRIGAISDAIAPMEWYRESENGKKQGT